MKLKLKNFFIFNKRNFSKYNFFVSIRKGGESTLKNDIKYIYVKDLLKYEKERKNFDKEKKIKHLIKLTKTNGGIQLKCSISMIYLLSLKCKYVESIWLNLLKNKTCNSLNCLEDLILNIEWNKFLDYNDLINIPLKIICVNSKLYETTSIKNTVYKCLNTVIDSYKNNKKSLNNKETIIKTVSDNKINKVVDRSSDNSINPTTLNTFKENDNKQRDDDSDNYNYKDNNNDNGNDSNNGNRDNNIKRLNSNETIERRINDNLNNIWNLLSIHIENNICNVDIKFTGKLSPRFYEYGNIKEMEDIKNIEKYHNINFFSLFNNDHKINDEKIKDIVNENIPFWSICEEKKRIQIDHQNMELNEEKNHYKYNFFSNKLRKGTFDRNINNAMLLSSSNKVEEVNKNYDEIPSEKSEQVYSIIKEEEEEEKTDQKFLNHKLENENIKLKSEVNNKMLMNKEKNQKKVDSSYMEKKETDKNYVINYLRNMEIRRMNYYNNNFFLSDDCYDSSSCIYSLIIQKCIKNKDKINVIWDPFCSSGILIFELINYFLNIPSYNEKEILPFMNLKIFDKKEFSNIYNFCINNINNNYNNIHLVGSDNRNIMITQCKKNLIRYYLYYKSILKKIKLKSNKNEKNKNTICSSGIKKNSFLSNALRENIKDDDWEETEYNEVFYDEKSDINFVRDLDELYEIEKDKKKKKKNEGEKKSENKIKEIEPKEKKKETEMKNEEINIKIPDIDTISISTEEDKKYNLNFPFDISFHKAHFFNIAPFIKNAMIITKIPHFSFSKELGISKKALTLYEQFDQMLCSKSDWLGVYVLIRNNVFLNKSKLEWNKILSIKDSKGRYLTLLSWSGRKKSLYSLSTENDRLKELEKFSEKLKFDI